MADRAAARYLDDRGSLPRLLSAFPTEVHHPGSRSRRNVFVPQWISPAEVWYACHESMNTTRASHPKRAARIAFSKASFPSSSGPRGSATSKSPFTNMLFTAFGIAAIPR